MELVTFVFLCIYFLIYLLSVSRTNYVEVIMDCALDRLKKIGITRQATNE